MPQSRPPSSHLPTIVVVEDSVLVAMALQKVLSGAGYRVTVTHNGRDALAAITAETPDLVITDLMMPDLDGAALIREIRAAHPELPIIVATGRPPPGGLSGLAKGSTARMALLDKPVMPDELLRNVPSLLPV